MLQENVSLKIYVICSCNTLLTITLTICFNNWQKYKSLLHAWKCAVVKFQNWYYLIILLILVLLMLVFSESNVMQFLVYNQSAMHCSKIHCFYCFPCLMWKYRHFVICDIPRGHTMKICIFSQSFPFTEYNYRDDHVANLFL